MEVRIFSPWKFFARKRTMKIFYFSMGTGSRVGYDCRNRSIVFTPQSRLTPMSSLITHIRAFSLVKFFFWVFAQFFNSQLGERGKRKGKKIEKKKKERKVILKIRHGQQACAHFRWTLLVRSTRIGHSNFFFWQKILLYGNHVELPQTYSLIPPPHGKKSDKNPKKIHGWGCSNTQIFFWNSFNTLTHTMNNRVREFYSYPTPFQIWLSISRTHPIKIW